MSENDEDYAIKRIVEKMLHSLYKHNAARKARCNKLHFLLHKTISKDEEDDVIAVIAKNLSVICDGYDDRDINDGGFVEIENFLKHMNLEQIVPPNKFSGLTIVNSMVPSKIRCDKYALAIVNRLYQLLSACGDFCSIRVISIQEDSLSVKFVCPDVTPKDQLMSTIRDYFSPDLKSQPIECEVDFFNKDDLCLFWAFLDKHDVIMKEIKELLVLSSASLNVRSIHLENNALKTALLFEVKLPNQVKSSETGEDKKIGHCILTNNANFKKIDVLFANWVESLSDFDLVLNYGGKYGSDGFLYYDYLSHDSVSGVCNLFVRDDYRDVSVFSYPSAPLDFVNDPIYFDFVISSDPALLTSYRKMTEFTPKYHRKSLNVLYIEDTAQARVDMKHLLSNKNSNIQLYIAENILEAYSMLKENDIEIDFALVDIGLSEISGLSFFLNAPRDLKLPPAMIYSALLSTNFNYGAYGFCDVMSKNQQDHLINRIHYLHSKHGK